MKKSLLFIAALSGAIIAYGQTANISITEGGSTTNRHIPIDSEALSDGIIMGDKADVDGGNVVPSIWRTLLDVFTKGEVNSLMAGKANTNDARFDLAESAIQPGDDVSELENDAGYLTSATLPPYPDITGKADVDGSNITPSVWRSLLDVLTSGQIDTLLESYVQTVGGIGPDENGDVTGIPIAATQLTGSQGFINGDRVPLYNTSGVFRGWMPVSAAASGSVVKISEPSGRLQVAYLNEAARIPNAVVNWRVLSEEAPTLQLAPAQDVEPKRYYPSINSPEIGDGSPEWEYSETIPSETILVANTGPGAQVATVNFSTRQLSGVATLNTSALNGAVPRRRGNGTIDAPSIESIDARTHGDNYVSDAWVNAKAPTLASSPAADVTEKRYSVELVVPASGDGDPYFEYVEIP